MSSESSLSPAGRVRRARARAALLWLLLGGLAWQMAIGIGLLWETETHRGVRPLVVPVDLATDPAWRLTLLPGIGRGRAQAIVAARQAGHVPRTLADLDAIPGIGPGTIARIRSTAMLRVRVAGRAVGWADEPP